MTELTAVRAADGGWQVTSAGAVLAGPFATMAEAWRWADRYEGEPVSKSETRAAWISDRIINGAKGL